MPFTSHEIPTPHTRGFSNTLKRASEKPEGDILDVLLWYSLSGGPDHQAEKPI